MWTLANLLRLAHSDACAELSDYARSSATTYADGYAHGGELVEAAQRMVREAEDVRLLAVAAERARGVSWETIGEALGDVSRQAAQQRFGERVDELELDVLLPLRTSGAGDGLSHTAGPDAAVAPDACLKRLDAWAQRHHEQSDPGEEFIDQLVSHGLRQRPREATGRIANVTRLADLLMNATGTFATRELPPGVAERYTRRRLLEEKVALYDAMRDEAEQNPLRLRSATTQATRDEAQRAWEELIEIRTEEARERLQIDWRNDEEATIAVHGRPVAVLASSSDPVDAEACGWWLWGVNDAGEADDRGGAWPQLVDEDLGAEREHVEHAALDQIASAIGSDQAKGIGPFNPGGIAGPPLGSLRPSTLPNPDTQNR
jgi:hypothetical protein